MIPEITKSMMNNSSIELSVVIPVYGCAGCLRELHARLTSAISSICPSWEIIFVDDRAVDGSWKVLQELAAKDPRVVAIRFSRNFGQQIAISAGIERSKGQMVAVMDCDLQDPPEVIPDLVSEYRKGADVVLARRESTYQGIRRRLSNRLYFWLLELLSGTRIDGSYGSLSLISRKVADAYTRFTESDRHYLFIIFWLGFTVRTVRFERRRSAAAASSYTYADLIRLAISGIFFQTTRLLRWVVQLGFLIALIGVSYGSYLAIGTMILGHAPPQGWTSLIVIVLFMSGVTITCVGIVGLYVARIFEQTKSRPLYILDEELFATQAVPAGPKRRDFERSVL